MEGGEPCQRLPHQRQTRHRLRPGKEVQEPLWGEKPVVFCSVVRKNRQGNYRSI